jgi:hypothetical protein
MNGLYQWHTALVAAFLCFVALLVIWGPGARGPGK